MEQKNFQNEENKSTNPRGEELNKEQLENTNGGGLLGGDGRSTLGGALQGGIGISNTDDDGDTESTNLDLGLGGVLGTESDD